MVTGDRSYRENYYSENVRRIQEGGVTMCDILDGLISRSIAEGRAEGIAEGRAEGIAEGRAEGIAEGIAEGELKEKIRGILSAVANGLSTEMIMNIFKVTREELNEIIEKNSPQ